MVFQNTGSESNLVQGASEGLLAQARLAWHSNKITPRGLLAVPTFASGCGGQCSRSLGGASKQSDQTFQVFFVFVKALIEASFNRALSKTKNPAIAGFDQIVLAEKEGFEPPEPWLQFNGFQDRRIRPLCHFSLCPPKL